MNSIAERLRTVLLNLHEQNEAADLIEQQAKRIKELEAERDGWREDANISRNSIAMLKDRCNHLEDTLDALRQRIADVAITEAERQEPVAWMGEYNIDDIRDHYTVVMRHKTDFEGMPDRVRPLYTHPQPVEKCDHIPVTTFGGDFCIKCNEPMDGNEHPQPAIPAWQPIETAPRDGTDILIYTIAGSMYVAGYDDAFSNVWRIRNDEGVNARVVTHWMPLPAAPKEMK